MKKEENKVSIPENISTL